MRSDQLAEVKDFLTDNGFPNKVDTAVVLGSGLSGFASYLGKPVKIRYQQIPEFPKATVQGHDGSLIAGTIGNQNVMIFSGRFHHYEGYSFSTTVLPVHLSNLFSAEKIIISNAAGAVNTKLNVGDLVVIEDIFRLFQKVSVQPSQKFIYNLYSWAEKTKEIASETGLHVQYGTYLYVKGPNYETKAEIRAFQRLGIDVVGMSTVPELIEATRIDLPAIAISLVTNMAAGLGSAKLDHSEVKHAADSRKEDFAKLVIELIKKL